MAKAIAGAALLAGAVTLDILTAGAATGATALEYALMMSLYSAGASMEAGAIAQALTSNRGMDITTRQAAANRQVIYGQQRVGGVMIFKSTTGSSHDQMNFVIVLAGHEVDSIQNLYLDGRQVHWQGSGAGWSVRNGVGFGGVADGGTYTGPDGLQYNFGGTGHSGIYCEARYGDQSPGDVISGLTANDPDWAAVGSDSPWLGGCTYVYLKVEYNTTVFPNEPEIRFTVNGKNNIFDPRTSTSGFTQNWALIAADVITDTVFGLGDNTVNQAQLIAAANVCDETVALGVAPGTLTESRYTTNYHYDTGVSPGDVLAAMMPGAGGQLSRIGGEWFLWPAYWQGPSFSFSEGALTSDVQWKPYRSVRELVNRVNGTYVAPTYPYNIAGNLYDSNGFYNGRIQNNFPFAYQKTSFPQYAADTLHGYPSDEWLNEDGGVQHPSDLSLNTVLSVSQAQRLAKIALLRNRQQGSGSFDMALSAFAMQPTDVMSLTFPANGWTAKTLEITGVSFKVDEKSGEAPSVRCTISVIETDPSVYEWSTTEELTVYDVPAQPSQTPLTPAPPTNMTLLSGAGTALVGIDGSVTPRIEVQWNTPFDVRTKQIQIQYQLTGASVWSSAPPVDVSLNLGFITGIIAGQTYNVRIRGVRATGVFSAWVEVDGFVASITLPTTFGVTPIAQGVLIAEAPTVSTADILVPTFVAKSGSASVVCLPMGEYVVSGLLQNTPYYVYYVDPTFAGGAIVPIATTSTADFLGKSGYYLIDVVKTPSFVAGSGNFNPAKFNDLGNSNTLNPSFAADGYSTTSATVISKTPVTSGAVGTLGQGQWLGFPNTALSYDTTLNVTATITTVDGAPCSIVASIRGIDTALVTTTVSAASTTYSIAVPRNTNLSMISLTATANGAGGAASASAQQVTVAISEIWIPYVGNTGSQGSDDTLTQPIVYTGLSSNLVPNGTFILGNIDGWEGGGGSFGSGGLLVDDGGGGAVSPAFSVIPGQKYRFVWTGMVNGAGTQSVYHRLYQAAAYSPNINTGGYTDFMGGGTIGTTLAAYTYDWTCPAGIYYCSMGVYQLGTAQLFYSSVSAQDYVAAAEWGADKTGDNTSLDTVYVNGVASSAISPIAGLMPVETGADKTLNHVLTTTVSEAIVSSGGSVSSTGFSPTTATNNGAGSGPPSVTIAISGDGTGATASVSWVGSGGPTITYTPTVTISNVGTGYTYANATVTVTVPTGTTYTGPGSGTYACSVTSGTHVQLASGSPTAYTVVTFSVVSNDISDTFSLQAVIQFQVTGFSRFILGQPCALGYVDCPAAIGTSPLYGTGQPSVSVYRTFGFASGAIADNAYLTPSATTAETMGTATFFGSVTGLSPGTHTLSLIFLDYTGSGGSTGSTLLYAHAELTQISS